MTQTAYSSVCNSRRSRRDLVGGAIAGAIGLSLSGTSVFSSEASAAVEGVELPPDLGQSGFQVYIPETEHTIRGTMLDYWRANGAAYTFGNPISEPFASPDGYYSQAFQRAILQFRPEFLWSEEPIVRMMPIFDGSIRLPVQEFRRDERRDNGGGNRRAPAWRPLPSESSSVSRAIESGGVFFEETGHTLKGSLLDWYQEHEGHFYLGHAVSEGHTYHGRWSQFFEGGLLVEDEDRVRLAPLDNELIRRLKIDTRSVRQAELPAFDELLFWEANNPNPLGDPYTVGRKWIEIGIGQQQLWVYHGANLISSTLVSTGLSPNDTEQGLFRVRLKYLEQDMQGFTDDSGEVLGTGADAPAGAIPYAVEDVPHVMYFNLDAEALHGAYWHNNFGTPMSHGCVNLPLDFATFLYGWAPLGTMVWVHE